MSTVLTAVLGIVLLLANLALHEAFHALALRELGGKTKAAGLGIPLPPTLRLAPTARRPFTLTLSPWLLAAYVEPDERSTVMLEDARYVDRAWFYAAGVVGNLLTAAAAVVIAAGLNGRWWTAVFGLVFITLLWFGRKLFTAIMPIFGVVALAFIVWSLTLDFESGRAAGPIAAWTWVATFNGGWLILAGSIPLALALFNMVPIYPLDGGRVMDAFLEKVSGGAAHWYRLITGIAFALLVVYLLVTDVIFTVS